MEETRLCADDKLLEVFCTLSDDELENDDRDTDNENGKDKEHEM